MKTAIPLVFGFVLLFAFVLMLVSFRSIVIATKAVLLNLLSVGAAYGVLVLVFQHGWGKGLLGFEFTGGIDPFLPILLFVILFGLSMDYHVFILSRIREGYDRGMRTDEAIAHGIKSTAGVVTSAAIVMVGVFCIFGALQAMIFKQFGVGLAAAILIDATIIRAILLPASMKLLGEWNWYLPKWLEWLLASAGESHEKQPGAPPVLAPVALGRETAVARVAIAVVGLHYADVAFLQPEPGVSAGDHLVSGLVPIGLLGPWLSVIRGCGPGPPGDPRDLSRAVRARLDHRDVGRHVIGEGPAGADYTGVLAAVAGAMLSRGRRVRPVAEPQARPARRGATAGVALLGVAGFLIAVK